MLDFIRRKNEAIQQVRISYTCAHVKTHLTKYTCSNGSIQFVMQCDACFAKVGNPIKHKFLTWKQRNNAPSFDDHSRSAHREAVSNQYALARQEFNSAAWWEAYNIYLESDEWKIKRKQVLNRDDGLCTEKRHGCTYHATEVHHLTYRNVGDEPLEDLTSVCHHCHEAITRDSHIEWRIL